MINTLEERMFAERVAIVTGGSRGLGEAIAVELGRRGAHVVISFTSAGSEAKAYRVVERIRRAGSEAIAVRADQAQPAEVRALVDKTQEHFGGLDILVNNAAVAWLGHSIGSAEYDIARMDEQWAINTAGVVATIRAAARVMRTGGRIVSIGSGAGTRVGGAGIADYAASKAAVNGFSRGAAHDLAHREITVNVVQAGVMDTEMAAPYRDANADLVSRIPIKRPARLEEVVAGVLFLASPAASYVTGSILNIEGGFGA